MENSCRHYLGLYPDNRPSCQKGRNVREWAMRCNGASNIGIARRLPCSRQTGDDSKTLFQCPDLDRKTDAEILEEKEAFSQHISKVLEALPKIQDLKKKMIKGQLSVAKATCVWCGEKDAMILNCAITINNHVHVKCSACGEGFME